MKWKFKTTNNILRMWHGDHYMAKVLDICPICGGRNRHNKLFANATCPLKKEKK